MRVCHSTPAIQLSTNSYVCSFTGYSSRGFVVLLGFLQAVYTLEGCETAAQVAEESRRSELLAPLAIVASIAGSWLVGLVYLLALLFSVQSIPSVASTSLALPIAQLFLDASGRAGAIGMLVIVGGAQGMAAATAFAASGRLLYALARDEAVPSKLRKLLMSRNKGQSPWAGVWVSAAVSCIVSCAYIGSAVAVSSVLWLFAVVLFARTSLMPRSSMRS